MFLPRKKAWRKLKNRKRDRRIRYLLSGILVLELAFFLRESGLARWVRVTNVEQIQMEREKEDALKENLNGGVRESEEEGSSKTVYGIQFWPGTGSLDFYRNETIIQKNEKGLVSGE